jgi:carboxyl-terminal processing protease
VQNIYPLLTTGGALKVTVQQYYTPNRKQVHDVGIAPDMKVIGVQEQLLKSLHVSGIQQMSIELLPTKMRVNGEMVRGKVDVVRKDGKIYLPARFLAAVMNADIAWEAKAKEVRMTRDGSTVKFPQKELLAKDGSNYIELSVFQNAYPSFRWDGSGSVPRIDVTM